MPEAMENVGAATNVALGIKKADYEEFIEKLDAILNHVDGDPILLLNRARKYYQSELDFINEIL